VLRIGGAAALAALVLLIAALPASGSRSPSHPRRAELLGAWRLVRIDYWGPKGPAPDPFYQPDSDGLLIYDASGWMSVAIGARHREPVDVPESRLDPAAPGAVQARAAAFDSYYAYFGSWSYDRSRSVVTHHVESSLISSENGLDYSQELSIEGGRLIFINRRRAGGQSGSGEVVRRKIWEHLPQAATVGKS
jgi:hypothetical protein